jgi:hypothetical protein
VTATLETTLSHKELAGQRQAMVDKAYEHFIHEA